MQTEADRSAQRCIVASFKNLYPNIHIVAEEVDTISQNLDVPDDWLITDLDSKILALKCPGPLLNITEDQVCTNFIFIILIIYNKNKKNVYFIYKI